MSRPSQVDLKPNGKFIKVNRDIHKGKRVNIVFYILHIIDNNLITLLGIDKILVMGHDPSVQRRCIRLFESSQSCMRCGRGRDELY